MAKNDYPVIVYQILSYLYKCLKSGDDVQGILLNYDSPMFDLNDPLKTAHRSTKKVQSR